MLLRKPALLVAGALFAAHANADPAAVSPATDASEHVVEHNFTAGETKQAYVGDAMVRVKDYYKKAARRAVWSISQPVKVEMGIGSVTVVPGDYAVQGQETLNGTSYDVIAAKAYLLELTTMAPSSTTVEQTLLVNADGGIRGPANAWASGATTADAGYRAARITNSSIDASRSYLNFELIYGGSSGGAIHIGYREYGADDPGKTAFFQDLTYDAHQNPVRFRNLSLEVEKVTSDSITFRVLEMPSESSVAQTEGAR